MLARAWAEADPPFNPMVCALFAGRFIGAGPMKCEGPHFVGHACGSVDFLCHVNDGFCRGCSVVGLALHVARAPARAFAAEAIHKHEVYHACVELASAPCARWRQDRLGPMALKIAALSWMRPSWRSSLTATISFSFGGQRFSDPERSTKNALRFARRF